jgi:hypothetical protein
MSIAYSALNDPLLLIFALILIASVLMHQQFEKARTYFLVSAIAASVIYLLFKATQSVSVYAVVAGIFVILCAVNLTSELEFSSSNKRFATVFKKLVVLTITFTTLTMIVWSQATLHPGDQFLLDLFKK